ncbi:phage tail sheath family protein [Pedobacter psychroterrae]|uniref:Phage tail sheath family protein n=1 Tax=Pedobacter psychroterrae TaxID=2530453 RepID=A0A4V2MLF2_9SPHI|nr:phage tail sheath C-terminal domain-containing protein [Pedobacter psychroterrae]TCD01767.1 phage tail sheath family protein [Pedobacter psychroterrae]
MPVSNYSTPGVYVEEISTLPPSVVQASTAIPAFLGYTAGASDNGIDLKNIPTRITSMLEYQQYFGGPATATFTISATGNSGAPDLAAQITEPIHKLYYSLDLFFKNGGSVCYIVSVGTHTVTTKLATDFSAGLTALKTEEEPTLIVLSEAVDLATAAEYHALCKSALEQCAKIKNRFCIFDVPAGDPAISAFRTGVGSDNLKFGAAYYPFLKTSLGYTVADTDITVTDTSTVPDTKTVADARAAHTKAVAAAKAAADAKTAADASTSADAAANKAAAATRVTAAAKAVTDAKAVLDKALADANVPTKVTNAKLDTIKATNTVLYNAIKLELNNPKYKITLPPSPAIAGVYAAVDSERGVWKAPANVSLNAVINPAIKITADEQDKLNIDSTGGKSINAIRTFTGRGVMVWGARTLAGNDNEWRYVPVRRLFNMIEDSAAKATQFAVFEPNDSTTWLKVKSMIESFLYNLWQQGALAGPTPKASYFVNVGLGATMNTQDILEGKMIVEIGVAAVRPAEFIVLRFSHKLQEA